MNKDSFDIKLVAFDPAKKIVLIKEVRAFAQLGLKEAKDLIEKPMPNILMKQINKETAEAIKLKLTEIGATIELE